MVLGEKIADEKGKVIGMSVKSVGPDGVHIEESFVSEVKGFGRFPSGRDMGTHILPACVMLKTKNDESRPVAPKP